MTTVQNSHIRNGLLAALAPDDLALLAPHLREVLLLPGDLLHQPGEKIEQVYFCKTALFRSWPCWKKARASKR